MYEPIKNFFLALDYEVRGEVLSCDTVVIKGSEVIIIEMKKSMNLSLIYQAMDRQKSTNQVYVAIPRVKNTRSKQYKSMLILVKKLELGLITVAMDSPYKTVEILTFPPDKYETGNEKRLRRIVKEAEGRSSDGNRGGSTRRKLLTAFREKNIKIACLLEKYGEMSAAELVNKFGCEKNTGSSLRANYYGWFKKTGKGIYGLGEGWAETVSEGSFSEIIELYRAL